MTKRLQLNLRLDGRHDLLELCKEVAATQGLSLNAWVIKQLELGVATLPKVTTATTTRQTLDATRQTLDMVVDTTRQTLDRTAEPLDKSLDVEVATELPGKHHLSESEAESLSQELRELRSQLEAVQVEREDLAQLKKQVKEHAVELHREGRSIELEKDRWQGELSEARANLAAANATIVQQKGKIIELERGYSLKPNPAEQRLRLEIGELQTELAEMKQNPVTAIRNLPEAADLLNQLKAKRKKSKADLVDLEVILEILEN